MPQSLAVGNPALGTVDRRPQTAITPAQQNAPFVRKSRKATSLQFDSTGNAFAATITPQLKAVAGYLRSYALEVIASGGSGASVTGTADAPFNVISLLTLRDATGQPIINTDGFGLYAFLLYANMIGGAGMQDIAKYDSYSAIAGTTGNFTIPFYLPFELDTSGYCSLPSLSSAALPQLQLILGITTDITERKQAERELRELSGHLIAAQEEERARIARELHDDLSQRLALLAVELQTLNHFATEVAAAESLDALVQRVREISEDVHSLSHRLHPALLDRVGLVPALRKLCKELQAQSGIKLTVSCGDVPDALSKSVSVGLFRVAQEALANVVKHSGAAAASIELTMSHSTIRLKVMDYGHGFEQSSNHRHGLGLLSMRERVRLIGGQFTVRSHPSNGTVIQAEIPLPGARTSLSSLKTSA